MGSEKKVIAYAYQGEYNKEGFPTSELLVKVDIPYSLCTLPSQKTQIGREFSTYYLEDYNSFILAILFHIL